MKAEMKPRERVLAALNHQEPDRVPIDLAQCEGDGISAIAYRKVVNYLGLENRPLRYKVKARQTVKPDEDVLRRFRVDLRSVDLGPPDNWKDVWLDERTYRDEWGITWTMPEGGFYFDVIGSPFAEDGTLSALERFPWPDPADPGRYRGLRERARQLREETDYAVAAYVNCSVFGRVFELRGWENFYADMLVNREFAEALMDRNLEIRLEMARIALEQVAEYVDLVVTADDLGMTDRTLVSPALFRSLIKPRLQRVFDFLKAHSGAKLYLHSDGAIYPFIPDLIELGVDALNPVQVSAEGMGDTARLKREFGEKITFWGAIDTHQVLPWGTPEQVREEVRRRIRDLAPGGGYVVCPVQNLQSEVPPQNIVAMYDEAYEFGRYPVR